MKTISKVLVANRGEIARRVMRACRDMGIATVAVFSDADANALFVREADEAVRIGPAPSRESYLVIDKIIAAAKKTGADAVHPGYGFLSENTAFARACRDAGITFIGPSPEAIASMGLKREAKEIAKSAGVPIVPGYNGAQQDDATLMREAERVGFPILVKASAGGGGKGMRVVHKLADLAEGIASARREAENAFGDGTLILEKYIERPRHIEIQILGDEHGNLVHLFERECSIQRRHQKVVEETPSVLLTPELRATMGDAAVRIGKAIGYSNAGTVEFIATNAGEFYFLEVNTRLQVEHPVTELVVGLDLVREQIRVARGERLGYAQGDLKQTGAAIEVRLCAEDPTNEFLPSTGTIVDYSEPNAPGLRVDSGIARGSVVDIYYDPMLAKVIAYGATREEARLRLLRGLSEFGLAGVEHNLDFLRRILAHDAFVQGDLHTHFLDEHFGDAAMLAPTPELRALAASVAALHCAMVRRSARAVLPSVRMGFRNNRGADESVTLKDRVGAVQVSYRQERDGRYMVAVDGASQAISFSDVVGATLVVEDGQGHRRRARVVVDGERVFVRIAGASFAFAQEARFAERVEKREAGSCVAPMPGKIIALRASVGEHVKQGDVLVVLEAMKMEHSLRAPEAGVVKEVRVQQGQQVDADALLVVVGSDASASS